LANLAGILVVAGVVLLSQGYGHWKRAGLGLVLVAALSTLLLEPVVVEVEVIPLEFHHFTSTPDSTDND
jgi:hypothetical protein